MSAYIYILCNPAFPDLFKVGSAGGKVAKGKRGGLPQRRRKLKTGTPVHERADELSRPSGVPAEYGICFYREIPYDLPRAFEIDKLHRTLDHGRFRPEREFFKLPLAEIREAIARELGEAPPTSQNGETIAARMNELWKQEREKFWQSVEPLHTIIITSQFPNANLPASRLVMPLSDELPLEQKIEDLCALVNERRCQVKPHLVERYHGQAPWPYQQPKTIDVSLDLFSKNGVCFSYLDIPILYTGMGSRNMIAESVITNLSEMCDALAKLEADIYARAASQLSASERS